MKPRGRVLVLAGAVLAALLLLTGAAAGSETSKGFDDGFARVHLAGTHGYRITIFALSGDLIVMARKGTASVSYVLIKSGLRGDRIHARLPGVGRVFLKFHDHSRPGRSVDTCRGSETTRKGVFIGTVKIEGERGYTSAFSHHVRGELGREEHGGCHRWRTARATSNAGSRLLSASTSRGNGRLMFTAFDFPLTKLGPEVVFGASFFRVRGQMLVTTTQSALAKHPTDLEISDPPRSASVMPPAPFTGGASFQQAATDRFSWTGDLAVELPGVGVVSLAGPKFETAVCVGHRCRGDKEEVESNSVIAEILRYGSGSHSQPLALARLSSLR